MSAEDELRAYLPIAPPGTRLIHLHFGRLANPALCDLGLRYSAVEAGCQEIAGLVAETRLMGRSLYPDGAPNVRDADPLYHILDLASNAGLVLRYLETATASPRH